MCELFSPVQLLAILWTVARQAPLSMEVSRQEYWSGCHSLLQGILPTQGSNLGLLCYRKGGDKYFLLTVLTLEVIILFNLFLFSCVLQTLSVPYIHPLGTHQSCECRWSLTASVCNSLPRGLFWSGEGRLGVV